MATILHVEKDESVKALMAALLSARGHHVDQTADGQVALTKVVEKHYDMIIVGDELNDIDGIGLLTKLSPQVMAPLVFISNRWREANVYQHLKRDLKVVLVVHRPLKAGLLGAQIEDIFLDGKGHFPGMSQEENIFKTLQSNYLRVLPERVSLLDEAITTAKLNPDDLYSIMEAQRLAHNLKGTAASCGFGLLGESAGSLEKALSVIKENNLAKNETAWEEIELIASLVRANASALCANPASFIDKRAFSTIETSADSKLLPPMRGPAIPQDNFDTFDDASSVRVLVLCRKELAADRLTTKTSSGLNVQIIPAHDKAEALAKAEKLTLDAVLVDIEVDQPAPALTLARELRSMPGYESLPVAFLSTSKQQKYIEDSTHAGASLMVEDSQQKDMLDEAIDYLISARQGGRPRVLVVDDDEDFIPIVASVLGQEGMLVKSIKDSNNILSVMQDFHPDLVMLDVKQPVVSGYDVCRLLRGVSNYQDLPIIFLTSQVGLEARLAAYEAGGDDYLPKPVASVELLTRVKVRLERSRMMKDRSNKDVLTGLMIRRAFMEELTTMAEESKRNGLIFSLALIDVDHFKIVNDTYGHLAGDRALAGVGHLLKKRFRVEDIRGRWGGEEFIVAFRHIQKGTAQGALLRALEELRNMAFKGDKDEDFKITFSAGIVSYPEDSTDVLELLKLADHRLYKAKESGRNCLVSED